MRGRLYDPEIGQFLQADPVVTRPFSQGLNRFAYVENSPLNLVDPTGRSHEPPGQGGGTCIIGSHGDCDVAGTGSFGGDVVTVGIAAVGVGIGVYGLGNLAIQGATAAGWIQTGDASKDDVGAPGGGRVGKAALDATNTGLAIHNIPGDPRRVHLPPPKPNVAPSSGLGQGASGVGEGAPSAVARVQESLSQAERQLIADAERLPDLSQPTPVPTTFDEHTEHEISTLHPTLQRRAREFLGAMQRLGHDIRIVQGARSNELQQQYYDYGRTTRSPVQGPNCGPLGCTVTNAKPGTSAHNFGKAFDINPVPSIEQSGARIAPLFGLEPGYNFETFVDPPHFQLPDWQNVP